jgi:uncharacterized membrane protein
MAAFAAIYGGIGPGAAQQNQRHSVGSEALTIPKLAPFTIRVYRSRRAGLLVVCWLVTACSDSSEGNMHSVPSTAGTAAQGEPEPASGWCSVQSVLEARCQRCHGEEPQHGAPFALVSYHDTQVVNVKGKPRYELIAAAVSGDFMPPVFLKLVPPVEPLTDLERAALLDWCERGAPEPSASDPPCDTP